MAASRGRAGRRAGQRGASELAKAAVPDIAKRPVPQAAVPEAAAVAVVPDIDSSDVDPAFHRAILKIALELRRPGAEGYDEVVERTTRTLRLDGGAFRRYLGKGGARNMSLLLSAARRLGSSA
jgi:hypothetical protein